MAEKGDEKKDDGKSRGSKQLTRDEYDRLVNGVDDIFIGGLDEPVGEKKPLPEKSASETTKREDDAGRHQSCVDFGFFRAAWRNKESNNSDEKGSILASYIPSYPSYDALSSFA